MARKRRRIDAELHQAIQGGVLNGTVTNAAQMYRELAEQFPDKEISERTVRDIVNELMPPDPSGPWQSGPDNNPQDDALILESMAAWLTRGSGRPWNITRHHARWIAWVRSGWPDLDPLVAIVLAEDYRARCETGRDCGGLDAFLAFAPWRSQQDFTAFYEANKAGRVVHLAAWYWTTAVMKATIGAALEEAPQ